MQTELLVTVKDGDFDTEKLVAGKGMMIVDKGDEVSIEIEKMTIETFIKTIYPDWQPDYPTQLIIEHLDSRIAEHLHEESEKCKDNKPT